jgi:hypothetical protein
VRRRGSRQKNVLAREQANIPNSWRFPRLAPSGQPGQKKTRNICFETKIATF